MTNSLRRSLRASFFLIVTFALAAPFLHSQTADGPRTPLPESIREIAKVRTDDRTPYVSRTQLTAAECSEVLQIEVVLKLRHLDELRVRVSHGERIRHEEMRAKYHPLASDYQRVANWLKAQGLTITYQDENHLAVFATGTVAQLARVFRTNFVRVSYKKNEHTSAISAPSLPSSMTPFLLGVNGLQTHVQYEKQIIARPADLNSSNPPFLPSQLAATYNATPLYNSNITGAGQTIAIVIDTFPNQSDLTQFWQTYGINQSFNNVTFIQVVSGTLPAPSGEETLDTEWSSSMAPGAKVRVYAAHSLNAADLDQCYYQVYHDVTSTQGLAIHQLSMSFGGPENLFSTSQLQTDQQYFDNLATAGVTVFASSGDQGANADTPYESNPSGVSPEYPASDPSVTGVGGTSLYVDSNSNPVSETVWNSTFGGNSGASGGGISSLPRPSWQVGMGVPSGSTRLVPDVACAADPNTGAVVILNGTKTVFGGTSWSSPTWAGFCALLNQSRANSGLSPIGPLGPSLYPLLGTSSFRDITSGNNSYAGLTGYYAGPGYDLCTGLGVPNVSNLVEALSGFIPAANQPPTITDGPPPASASTASAYNFSFTAYAPTGTPAPTYNVTSGTLPSGLTLSSTGVISGTPTKAGTYTGTVTANGISANAQQSFSITVTTPSTPPSITNNAPTAATLNLPFSFTYTFTGNPAPTFTLTYGSLPTGLTLSSSGLIFGTPTEVGTYSGTVTASNGVYPDAQQPFWITVTAQASPPSITNNAPTSATINLPLSFTYSSTGSPTPTFALTSGSLPTGLSLSPAGVISGTPTQLGSFSGQITASNDLSSSASTSFDLNIAANPLQNLTTLVDLNNPGNSLAQDSAGNFYTSTKRGGSNNLGCVSEISPAGVQSVLHNFGDGTVLNDGNYPNGLLVGSDGNLYGTSVTGGDGADSYGDGTIFQITPQGVETILYSFNDGSTLNDGTNPDANLVQGTDGDFYGTTETGGVNGYGVIFKISPQGDYSIIYQFGEAPNDGQYPEAALVQGLDGNFYGTTGFGGTEGAGTIFKVTPEGQETILHNFGDGSVLNDAENPETALVVGSDGTLYGGAVNGGSASSGAIFSLTQSGVYTILYNLGSNTVGNEDIFNQDAPINLIEGPDGNVYGLSQTGGLASDGLLFQVSSSVGISVMHSFGDGTASDDGQNPSGNLIVGSDGNLYSTTSAGGLYGNGTLFEVALMAPLSPPTITAAVGGNNSVGLTWAASASGAPNGYVLKRFSSPPASPRSTADATTQILATATSFTDTGLQTPQTYYYYLFPLNAVGSAGANSNLAHATTSASGLLDPGPFIQWLAQFGDSPQTSLTSTPDGDGLTVLLKYATNTPLGMSSTGPATLGTNGGYLTLSFNRQNPPPVNYAVEASTDLVSWTPIASLPPGPSNTWSVIGSANVNETTTNPVVVTVTDSVPISSTPRRFLRLKVSNTAP